MYRLRGLLIKGWRAALVLKLVARLTGNTPEKQLRQLEAQIAEAEVAGGPQGPGRRAAAAVCLCG